MRLATRKLLDRSFSSIGIFAILMMALALLAILVPVFKRGAGAYVFRGTIEHRRIMLERFSRGDAMALKADLAAAAKARQPLYDAINAYRAEQSEAVNLAITAAERLSQREDFLGRR